VLIFRRAAIRRRGAQHRGAIRCGVALLAAAMLYGCAGLPPGADYPKAASVALAHPEDTRLGQQFASAAHEHQENSGFRVISVGADGFRLRMQMIDAAQRTLDLQYYIFRGDETGRMLTDSLQHAADRGVRIRVLVDDGDTVAGDEQILRLLAYPSVEVRIFNPCSYRGHWRFLRKLDFVFHAPRLDYRMHNKLLVADNALALIGGRNIGNQYFQIDPESQFADEDVFTAGPVVSELSRTFDEFWNSDMAIPAKALTRTGRPDTDVVARTEHQREQDERASRRSPGKRPKAAAIDYASLLKTDEPFAGIVSGKLPLVWAHAQVVYDSPDKKLVSGGALPGRLIERTVLDSIREVQSEFLLVTPYFIPAADELQVLKDLRGRQARVRILTNSLESAPEITAQSGYDHYRVPLLENGVELYEVRSLLGSVRGSGQTAKVSRYGNYALHAKIYVFDRQKLFIGSMNYDQRSKRINTEIGLIIQSAELAQQTARRFDAMVNPDACYIVGLSSADARGKSSRLVWRTEEDGRMVEYTREPARSGWQRLKVKLLALLPLDREL
jgi:putative cardiolipin synthase